jgi:response regulator of citrate/malate metabolism
VILLTAAREMEAVRTAMRAGAMHYLIKPVDFAVLRRHLEAYAELHALEAGAGELDQRDVDGMFRLLRTPVADAARLPPELRSPTAERVVDALHEVADGLMATEVAERVGVSRATAQRYLSTLVRAGVVGLDLDYGATGRPRHRYRLLDRTSVRGP